jgi:hypothetical protein
MFLGCGRVKACASRTSFFTVLAEEHQVLEGTMNRIFFSTLVIATSGVQRKRKSHAWSLSSKRDTDQCGRPLAHGHRDGYAGSLRPGARQPDNSAYSPIVTAEHEITLSA